MNYCNITILPAPGCRRSRLILDYLDQHDIPFNRIPLESLEGTDMAEKYDMRASPGILVNGINVNPFDLLVQASCRVDEEKARKILMAGDTR